MKNSYHSYTPALRTVDTFKYDRHTVYKLCASDEHCLHIYADIQSRNTLIVCFDTGIEKTEDYTDFFGRDIATACDVDIICIPDITPQLHQDIYCGWHLGTPNVPLQPLYSQLLAPLISEDYEHIIFVGYGSNGFTALHFATIFPKATCLLFSPHTDISACDQSQVDAYLNAFYNKEQKNAILSTKTIDDIVLNLTSDPASLRTISRIICIQNTADSQAMSAHIKPLVNALSGTSVTKVELFKNAHIVYESWGNKDEKPPSRLYAAYIQKIINGCIGKESDTTPDVLNFLGIYKYRDMPEVFLGATPNFQDDPFNDRSWRWAINSFLFFDNHVRYGENITDKHVNYLNHIIRHWMSCYRTAEPEDEFPWHDHATALRVDAVTKYYELLISVDKLTPDIYDLLKEFIALNCKKLAQDDFYSKHTNHGFDQAIALFHGSAAFEMDAFIDTAITRFNSEIAYAFTREGVHVENSPGYHKGMISNVLRSLAIIKRFGYGDRLVFDVETFSENAVDFLMYAMRYDYTLPYIGDTETYGIHIHLPTSADLKHATLYEALCRKENLKKDSLPHIKLYDEAGYFFYRSDWSNIKESTHVIMKSGYLSHYHRQDDDLNLLLSAHGEDWLIDSGLYSYNKQDPIRKYMRSAKAHNVPLLGERRIIRDVSLKNTDTGIHMMDTPEGALCRVMAKTHMYENMSVRRRLTIIDSRKIQFSDLLSKQIKQPSHWLFHVPKDKKIVIEDVTIRIEGKEAVLLLRPNFVAYNQQKQKKSSQYKVSIYEGWNSHFPSLFSSKRGKKEDTQVIVITCDKVDFVHFDIDINVNR